MRLGKEQAVGYVEDTEADVLPGQEHALDQADAVEPVQAAEPALRVS
jgi:hypothetical protein